MASIKARKRYKNNPIHFASLIFTAYIIVRYVLESFWPLDHFVWILVAHCGRPIFSYVFVSLTLLVSLVAQSSSSLECIVFVFVLKNLRDFCRFCFPLMHHTISVCNTMHLRFLTVAVFLWVTVQGWSLCDLTIRKRNSQPVFCEESGWGRDFQSDPHTSSTISLRYGGFCLPSFSFLFFFRLRFRC
jgi:hypothetical protein